MTTMKTAKPERRTFLRLAPAATAGLVLTRMKPRSQADPRNPELPPYQIFRAAEIARDIRRTEARPGSVQMVSGPDSNELPFTMVLTTEAKTTAPGFESHQHRDHIFHILEGETEYEVGGQPQGGRMIAPGEWRGKRVMGATRLQLRAGDRLVIHRGTPHKRRTPGRVTFILTSPQGVSPDH